MDEQMCLSFTAKLGKFSKERTKERWRLTKMSFQIDEQNKNSKIVRDTTLPKPFPQQNLNSCTGRCSFLIGILDNKVMLFNPTITFSVFFFFCIKGHGDIEFSWN